MGGLCGLAALGTLHGCSGAVPVEVPSPRAESVATCRALVAALPARVSGLDAVPVDPDTPLAAAWGDPPIVVRCGVPPAPGLNKVATCQVVNGVDWFVPITQIDDQSADVVATTIGRRPVVQLRVPAERRPPLAAFVDVGRAVAAHTDVQRRCGYPG